MFRGPNRPGWGGRGVFCFGLDLEPELRALEWLLAPGDTVVDVGASTGIYSVRAARLVGPAGRVLALEPNPAMAALARANAAANGLGQVTVQEVAASDRAERAPLFEHRGRPNAYGLVVRAPGTPSFPVATDTLDALVAAAGLERLAVLKVDVEGAEAAVLAGAASVLAAHRPAVIAERTIAPVPTPAGYRRLLAPVPGPNVLLLAEGDRRLAPAAAHHWWPEP